MADVASSTENALASRYNVLRELGAGGMAVVYLARDLKHDRNVALKVLRPELAAALGVERFHREIEIAARLNHPHILPLLDSGTAEQIPTAAPIHRRTDDEPTGRSPNSPTAYLYYTMPYVGGESLREKLNADRQMSVSDTIEIAKFVAGALDYAHREGVVHRDIKPESILFQDGQPVLADFGIALAGGGSDTTRLTETGISIGTPQYMSPEQVAGESEVDGRSDIYSLAAVLYEMLAGETPHTGNTRQAIAARILTESPTPLEELRSTVPRHIAAAIHRSLAKAPEDRHHTASEFATAITLACAEDGAPRHDRVNRRMLYAVLGALAAAALIVAVLLWKPRVVPPVGIKSVAVLPLANISRDSGQAIFADGIHDALITELKQLSAFDRVISRTSVMRYRDTNQSVPEIASALDVDGVIDGSVQRVGDEVRVRVALIGAFPERDLWSHEYQSSVDNVLTLQRTIVGDIASEITLTLTPTEQAHLARPQPVNPEAFNLVLLGREAWNQRTGPGLRRAVALFGQAVAIDSNYAAAHVGLSDAYNMLLQYDFLPSAEGIPLALRSAERALVIDSTYGDAYTSLAEVHFLGGEWYEAEQAYRRAIDLNPGFAIGHHFFGWFLSHMGRHDEATEMLRRARELDPLSAPINADLAAAYMHARRYDDAWLETERTLGISRGFHRALWLQVLLELLTGDDPDKIVADAMALEETGFMYVRAAVAMALAAAGREVEARSLLEESVAARGGVERLSRAGATIAATCYLQLGDSVAMWSALDRMTTAGIAAGLTSLVAWPFFDPMREDPRFAELVERMRYTN